MNDRIRTCCQLVFALGLLLPIGAGLPAQGLTGFSAATAARQQLLEARLLAVPDTAVAQRHARILAAGPHVAGTPAQLATARYVLEQMASWGLDTSRVSYRVYLPYHDSTEPVPHSTFTNSYYQGVDRLPAYFAGVGATPWETPQR